MLGLLLPSRPIRTKRPSRLARLCLEQLETRDCPALVINLNTQFLTGHQVLLSGSVSDPHPAGINLTFNGVVSGNATTNSSGNFQLQTTASSLGTVYAYGMDSSGSFGNAQATLSVARPTITLTATQTGAHTVVLSGQVTDYAPAGLTVNFNGQVTASTTTNSSGYYSYTVSSASNGTVYAVTSDAWGQGSSPASQTITLAPPQVTVTNPGSQTNKGGDAVSVAIFASDSLGDTLTYGASNLPSGLSINSSTGVISGTIANNAWSATPYAVTVTAWDAGASVSASQSFNWTVNPPVVTLSNPGNQTNLSGAAISLGLAAADTDSYPLGYSASGLPSGLAINSATGVISGTIAVSASSNNPYAISVMAWDSSAGVYASQTFNWTVNASITPHVTLTTQVLAGHEVQLTGVASDDHPAGITVTFSGAVSGSATTAADGSFSFTTTAASLGTVTAVGIDQLNASTNTASATVAAAAPTVSLTVVSVSNNIVTLSGQVTDVDAAGRTVSFSGAAAGSVVTDSSGDFYDVTEVLSTGTITASTTDLWGQSSSAAQVSVTKNPLDVAASITPQITLTALVLTGHEVQLSGTVMDAQPGGVTVTFSGAASGSATTDSYGNFSYTTTNASTGTVYAYGIDQQGGYTNLASVALAVNPPILTLAVAGISGNTITLTGQVIDVDPAGETVTFSGAASGTAVSDANGDYSFTTSVADAGTILASTTDLWGAGSNAPEVSVDNTSGTLTATVAPQLTLQAQVLSGHQVQLSGYVMDDQPDGAIVTFSGAVSGTATTDANGYYSFTTTAGALGTVSASAVDLQDQSTNAASALVAVSAPALTLAIGSVSNNTVTLTGHVADIDGAGETVSFSGAAAGSTTTDANGNFSFTTSVSASGMIQVSAADFWGQTSNSAEVTVDLVAPPVPAQSSALNLSVAYGSGTSVTLSGQLTDGNVSGVTIRLRGVVDASVTTDADGKFSYTASAAAVGAEEAFTATPSGQPVDVAEVGVESAAPVIEDFDAILQGGNQWTFEGTVVSGNTAGMTVQFGGLPTLQGLTATTNSNGVFYITRTLQAGEFGTATAQTTDARGNLSNLAQVIVSV